MTRHARHSQRQPSASTWLYWLTTSVVAALVVNVAEILR